MKKKKKVCTSMNRWDIFINNKKSIWRIWTTTTKFQNMIKDMMINASLYNLLDEFREHWRRWLKDEKLGNKVILSIYYVEVKNMNKII